MRRNIAAAILSFFLLVAYPLAAQACTCCLMPECDVPLYEATKEHLEEEGMEMRDFIKKQFQYHQIWIVHDFWRYYMLPALKNMAAQLTAMGMYQMHIIGQFFDAKQQLETEQVLDALKAQAHKDYQPSTELCKVGSVARGLAPAGRTGQANAVILAQRSQDRQLGNINTVGAEGFSTDRLARLKNLKEIYCDGLAENTKIQPMCTGGSRPNNDVDYARMMGNASTLNLDFTDGTLTPGETDFLALANNLFAHDIFSRPSGSIIRIKENQDNFMDVRAVVAKRSVAENSFYAIAGLKASGPGNDAPDKLLAQMGAAGYAGPNPSYYSMLEVMAQKMYQDPNFYSNLYETPANTARKDVAMQAISLMLDRNRYKSELRYEAMLDVWLETEIVKYQDSVENRMNWLSDTGKEN